MKNQYESNIRKMYLLRAIEGVGFIGAILLPFFTEWAGLEIKHALFLQSWFLISTFVLEVPTGAIADKYSRKLSIIIAGVFQVSACLVYFYFRNFWFFMLAETLFAVGCALMSGADSALIYDSLKKLKKTGESKKVFARLQTFGLGIMIITAPIGAIVAARYGLNVPFLLSAIVSVLIIVLGLTLKEPKIKNSNESERYLNIVKDGMKFFSKKKALKVLAFNMVSIQILAYFMLWLYQKLLMDQGFAIANFGYVHAALVIAQILFMNSYGIFEKILGTKRRVLFFSGIMAGISMIVAALTNSIILLIITICLTMGFGWGRKPLFQSYMNKHIPSSKRATILSSVSMFEKFVIAAINPVIGYLADWDITITLVGLGLTGLLFTFISKVEEDMLIE